VQQGVSSPGDRQRESLLVGQTLAPAENRDSGPPEVSVVLPCLNEERTIGSCIEKALWALKAYNLNGEIIVSDNGSSDRSVEICKRHGVEVVHQRQRGYGNAYLKGIEAARGKYIVMADSDDTYDLRELDRFITPLRDGADLVMGNRFAGKILPGAMTWSHRYIGNPILSWLMKSMFGTSVGDSHSGLRSFTREAYNRLKLRAPGMEFASEMVINAARIRLNVTEVPITYYPREGDSKLRTIRDGWRHLRYMLLRSPTHLFFVPGASLLLAGLVALVPFLWGPVTIGGHPFDIHTMFFFGVCSLAGFQIMTLGLFTRLLAVREGVDSEDKLLRKVVSAFSLERGLLIGGTLLLVGLGGEFLVASKWLSSGFGALTLSDTRLAFFALIAAVLGLQAMFSSFYLMAILGSPTTRPEVGAE
jgi:hypothetical protein